jgi:hypothetical protein
MLMDSFWERFLISHRGSETQRAVSTAGPIAQHPELISTTDDRWALIVAICRGILTGLTGWTGLSRGSHEDTKVRGELAIPLVIFQMPISI